MKCYKCQQILPNDSVFCHYCGQRLEIQRPIQGTTQYDFTMVSNNKSGERKKVTTRPSDNINLILDIINLVVLILVMLLCTLGTHGDFWSDDYGALIFFLWIGTIVLQVVNIVKAKNNVIITIVMIFFLFIMIVSYGEYSHNFDDIAITLIMFCIIYLLVFELCRLFIKIIPEKYYATQSYKIRCYKKIEQINTYRKEGIITDEEFEIVRKQIMSKICY